MEQIQITDIGWERIYLRITLEGENLAGSSYRLATADQKLGFPLALNEDKQLILNITNVHHQQMLPDNVWYLWVAEGENGPWQRLAATPEVCRKCKGLDKVYRYGNGHYACVFTFCPSCEDGVWFFGLESTFMMRNRKPTKRRITVETDSLAQRTLQLMLIGMEKALNILYQVLSHLFPKKGNRILLMSETRTMGGNLQALDQRLRQRGLEKKFRISHYFVKTLEASRRKAFCDWLRLAVLTARQDFIFVDDYAPFFKFIRLHPKTRLIQVWHAGVGFKSVGYARFGEEGSPFPLNSAHRKYDWVIVGGEALREVYAEAFGVDREKCLPYGLMRMDGYRDPGRMQAYREAFYAKYPALQEKKLILFAPTYRGQGQRDAFYPYEVLDQEKIYEMCGEEYVFVLKMHPFIRTKMEIRPEFRDRIWDLSGAEELNDLFYVTEILVTDYSSDIYEFSLHGKPILSFAFDKEEYELTRSVHRSPDLYTPGKVCTTLDELLRAIRDRDFEMEKLKRFTEENFDKSQNGAADQVIDHILLH